MVRSSDSPRLRNAVRGADRGSGAALRGKDARLLELFQVHLPAAPVQQLRGGIGVGPHLALAPVAGRAAQTQVVQGRRTSAGQRFDVVDGEAAATPVVTGIEVAAAVPAAVPVPLG